ncbi:hypothetical protein ACWGKU_31070 [Kitasatospora sp. NPDC054768]
MAITWPGRQDDTCSSAMSVIVPTPAAMLSRWKAGWSAPLAEVEIPLGGDDAVPDEWPRDVEQQSSAELPALLQENVVDGLR